MTDQNKSVLPLSTCLHLLHDSENEMLESIVVDVQVIILLNVMQEPIQTVMNWSKNLI